MSAKYYITGGFVLLTVNFGYSVREIGVYYYVEEIFKDFGVIGCRQNFRKIAGTDKNFPLLFADLNSL